jgi:hypothetical protein
MNNKIQYEFSAKLWQYKAPGGWFFVTLPEKLSEEIRGSLQWQEEGWGRMKVIARTGNSEWKTSIWFDTKINTYLLPIKAEIRKKINPDPSENVTIILLL